MRCSAKEPRRNNFPRYTVARLWQLDAPQGQLLVFSSVQRTDSSQPRATLWVQGATNHFFSLKGWEWLPAFQAENQAIRFASQGVALG